MSINGTVTEVRADRQDIRWQPDNGFRPISLEKIIGLDNLLNICWLNRGLEVARAVCRICVTSNTGEKGYGTGFLIGEGLLMTNHHVINDDTDLAKSYVEFNYERTWNGGSSRVTRFQLSRTVYHSDRELDCTVVSVEGAPGQRFGFIDLEESAQTFTNDYVSIIQHPLGSYKQIGLTDNKVASVHRHYVQYTTDTEPGSSGSPVFDQDWRIVALHHAGGDLLNGDGQRYFINEGININHIRAWLQGKMGTRSEVISLVFGPMQSELISMIEDAQRTDMEVVAGGCVPDFLRRFPDFGNALQVGRFEATAGSGEVLPAAVLGVAVGAGIAHLATVATRENFQPGWDGLELAAEPQLRLPGYVFSREHVHSPRQLVQTLLSDEGWLDSCKVDVKVSCGESAAAETGYEALPVLAGVFLRGVLVGAAAYRAGKG
ncbi:trypsin-like peptidase domain-containing protein [bacterium]|nr:trypsin-like peptidase domain-containing protein [bacterium]